MMRDMLTLPALTRTPVGDMKMPEPMMLPIITVIPFTRLILASRRTPPPPPSPPFIFHSNRSFISNISSFHYSIWKQYRKIYTSKTENCIKFNNISTIKLNIYFEIFDFVCIFLIFFYLSQVVAKLI